MSTGTRGTMAFAGVVAILAALPAGTGKSLDGRVVEVSRAEPEQAVTQGPAVVTGPFRYRNDPWPFGATLPTVDVRPVVGPV